MGSPQDESHIQNYITPVQNATHQITSLSNSLLQRQKPAIYLSMQSSTRFGTYLYSVGTHHGNLLKSIVTEQDDLLYSTGLHERRGFKDKWKWMAREGQN